jgi:hypothetical protein
MAEMRRAKNKTAHGAKRGPKEERLKINGNWTDAVKLSFTKKKPKGGWPKFG